nr:reverse transcriptase domain-containing protein [Tanacetum cinerariifolium]
MKTLTVTSSTDSQMHNNIMAAGSRDRLPMLAIRRYPQWRSQFLRYIDTRPNGDALRKCILSGPYKPTTVLVQAVAATDDSLAIPEHTTVEIPMNMFHANKAHFEAEKESIHLYKGKEIAKPITALFESASEEDNDPEQAQRDKDMQKNLALIAKYFKKIYKPTNNNLRTSSNSRNKNVDTNPWYKNDNQSGQFGNQMTVNVVGARENVGSPVVQQSRIQWFNCKEFGHFAKECRKPKKVKDSAYHKEKMLLCKQAEKGVPLQAEQYDWLADTDEEIDEQELEAQYSYMEKIKEVPTADTYTDFEPLEQVKNDTGYNVFANDLEHSEQYEWESNSVWDSCLVALQNKQTEFEKYKALNDRTVDYDKLKRKLNETLGQLAQKDIEIKEGIPTASDEFPLPEDFPTASEERFPLLRKRDATAEEVCTANEDKGSRSLSWEQQVKMVKSRSSSKNEVFDDSFYSTSCKKNTESLNTKITELKIKFCEKIRGLEFNVECKSNRIEILTNELEELKKEKESLDSKLIGFKSAFKDLNTLLGSQRSDKIKEGLKYSVVPPSLAQVYSPPKKDMSWTGLPEFADGTITDYSRPSPSIESNSSDLQSSNSSVSEHEESLESIMSKPMIKFVKAADCPGVIKNNKTETTRKSPVKYAEMYRNTSKSPKVRGNQRNWNNLMNQRLGSNFVMKNKACFKCGHFDHLAYDCGLWVEKGKNGSKKNFTHKNVTLRADFFKTALVSAARRRVKRLERELKARTPRIKIDYVEVRGRSRFSNRRRIPNIVEPEIRTIAEIVLMADRTIGELLQAPTEGACPHHGFSELTQIDTFYNGLTEQDQDSLNAALGGNILNKTTREALKIIENKSKISNLVEIVNKQVIAPAKAVEKTYVTYRGAHAYYECIATDSNPSSVCAATNSYNQVSPPNRASHQIPPLVFALVQNNPNRLNQGTLLSNTVPNPKGEMKAVTTRSSLAYEGPSIPTESPLEKVDEQNTKEILDKEHSNSLGSTAQVQPPVVLILILEPNVPRTQTKPTIPYPSRLNDQKL